MGALTVSLRTFETRLAAVASLEAGKALLDEAAVCELFAARVHGEEACRLVQRVRADVERRLGELIRDMPKLSKAEASALGKSSTPREIVDKSSKKEALAAANISEQLAAKLVKIASIPRDQYEAVKADVGVDLSRAELLRVSGSRPANFSSESAEWYTPQRYVDAARSALGGFTLDPASSPKANETVRARRFFTQKDDGLSVEWSGRVWLNPPYGDGVTVLWVDKLVAEVASGRVTAAVLLVNAVTDRKWFQPLWGAAALCFTNHRIEFYTPSGQPQSPVSGNVFAYWGDDAPRFRVAFADIGVTVRRLR